MINDLKTQVISEYCKAILNLLIFSTFSDKQTFIKVPKSKTAYSREDIFGHAERQAPTLCFGINTCFLEEFVRQLQSRACFKNHNSYNDGLQLMWQVWWNILSWKYCKSSCDSYHCGNALGDA